MGGVLPRSVARLLAALSILAVSSRGAGARRGRDPLGGAQRPQGFLQRDRRRSLAQPHRLARPGGLGVHLGRRAVQHGPHHRHRAGPERERPGGEAAGEPRQPRQPPVPRPRRERDLRAAAEHAGEARAAPGPAPRPEPDLRRAPPRAGEPGQAPDPGPPLQPDHRRAPRGARQAGEPPDPRPRRQPDLGGPAGAARDPPLADLSRPLGEPPDRRDPGRPGHARQSADALPRRQPAHRHDSRRRWGAWRRSGRWA